MLKRLGFVLVIIAVGIIGYFGSGSAGYEIQTRWEAAQHMRELRQEAAQRPTLTPGIAQWITLTQCTNGVCEEVK